jgi:hypothetical protein
VVPDAATVAAGWEVHRRTPRFEVPDRRMAEGLARARTEVLLAHDGTTVRRDGDRAPDLQPGITEVLLGALDVLDRPAEVDAVVGRWPDRLGSRTPAEDASMLAAAAYHWLLHRSAAMLDWLLPDISAGVERLDKAFRRGRLGEPHVARHAARALHLVSLVLAGAGQADAGTDVRKLAERLAPGRPAELGFGPALHDPGLAGAANVVLQARATLFSEAPDHLDLLPALPPTWYGSGVEVHDAPTAAGRLSYAIRWHGSRPALLWDLVAHDDAAVTIRVPGLDPSWSTTEPRGDALLAEVDRPEGSDVVQVVAEHPDIDPAMRRPGRDPDPVVIPELPDGGSFS